MEKIVGTFSGRVGDPYPCWCEVNTGEESAIKFHHDNIDDLIYLLGKMKEDIIIKTKL